MEALRRALHRDEDGATLVIVAITLIALMGMVVLVVDVGGLLWKRREMVNASDAAALAAARTCAVSVATDPNNAEDMADQWASANAAGVITSGTQIVDGITTCRQPSGYVTVEYGAEQHLFFAPVLGFGTDGTVETTATAAWAPPGSINPVPIVLNHSAFQGDCEIPLADSEIGTECFLWFDNDRFEGSNFGFLSLEQWGVPAGENCNAGGGANQLEGWIDGNFNDTLDLNYPNPTYVCASSGNQDSVWEHLSGREGDILFFPINDWDGSLTGFPQLYNNGGTQVDKYNIIGYAGLQLEQVLDENEAGGGYTPCGPTPPFTVNVATPDLDLEQRTAAQGCGSFDDITNVVVSNDQSGQNRCCTEGTHYTFDETTHVIDFTISGGAEFTNVTASWDLFSDGPCGPQPSNSSSHCIVVSWQGYQFGGGQPGGGADFGVRSVTLCDRRFDSCPDQRG